MQSFVSFTASQKIIMMSLSRAVSSKWILEAGGGQYLYDHSPPHPPPTTETRTMEQHLSATSQPPPASHRLTSGGLAIILSAYQQSICKLSCYSFIFPFIFDPHLLTNFLTPSFSKSFILCFFLHPKYPKSNILNPSGSKSCVPHQNS